MIEQLAILNRQHQADHHHDMQSQERVRMAFSALDDALTTLSHLGHQYHLASGVADATPEWPRVMFHVEAAPNGRVVSSLYEAGELGAGWWDTIQAAQHAEGVRAQFAGRGGIGDRSVPMLLDGSSGPKPEEPLEPKDNTAVIAAWKKENGNGSHDG